MKGRCLVLAGVLGTLAVLLGAFGAHGLSQILSPEALGWVETGSRYQLIHAAALVGLAGLASLEGRAGRLLGAAALCLFAGAFLFGGALYLLALTDARWFGAVAPVGGALMIIGWCLAVAAGVAALGARVHRPTP